MPLHCFRFVLCSSYVSSQTMENLVNLLHIFCTDEMAVLNTSYMIGGPKHSHHPSIHCIVIEFMRRCSICTCMYKWQVTMMIMQCARASFTASGRSVQCIKLRCHRQKRCSTSALPQSVPGNECVLYSSWEDNHYSRTRVNSFLVAVCALSACITSSISIVQLFIYKLELCGLKNRKIR